MNVKCIQKGDKMPRMENIKCFPSLTNILGKIWLQPKKGIECAVNRGLMNSNRLMISNNIPEEPLIERGFILSIL